MNLSTVSGAWRVFKAGESVADPAKWKSHQITVNQVTLLLAAVIAFAKGLGLDLHIDDATLAGLGAGAFSLANWLLTVATTDKVGMFGQRAAPAAAAPVPAAPAEPGAGPLPGVGSAPAPNGVQRAPDVVRRQDDESLRAGG